MTHSGDGYFELNRPRITPPSDLLRFETVAFLSVGVLILFFYFFYFFYRVAVCHLRTERHADGMFNKAYRKALGQLSARKYLHSLMAKRVG